MRADQIQPKKLVVFDIDDTLVNTQTKVHVLKNGRVIKSLSSHDFTLYKLQPGESFDFGDFRNAREFFLKSRPIIPMMNQLKKDIATGNKVVMVTAREDFDDKELFLNTFRMYGIDIDKVHVYRAGNIKTGTTEQKKQLIIKNLLDKDNYSKAIMYDDAKPNLHSFMALKKTHPQTRFYAWLVSQDGQASEYMRENAVNERRKKRRPRWAAYGPGPYGGYGYYTGYSGDSGGDGGGDGGGMEEAEVVNFPNIFQAKSLAQELIKISRDADDPDRGIKFNKYYVELEKLGFKPYLAGGQFYLQHIQTKKNIPLNLREDAVSDLAKNLKNPRSYDAIDAMMQSIAKKHNISGKELHDLFVKKYGIVPDDYPEKTEPSVVDAIADFLPFAIKYLKLSSLPKITFARIIKSKHEQPTFGVYHHDDDNKIIELAIDERHPIDIIRTLAHELVHYKQDLEGKLTDNSWKTGSPTENQANESAGVMMRMFDKKYHKYMTLQAVELSEAPITPIRQPLVPPVNRVNQDPTRTRYGDVPRQDDPAPQTPIKKSAQPSYNLDAMLKQVALAKKLVDSMDENFADGKKPGRKGLAKRSGVNCKQSVSKLRSIAKNSSGERQRMAHWCANMKSGRNK